MQKLEISVGELNNIVESLNNIVKTPIAAKYAFKFGKVVKELKEDFLNFQAQRDNLIRKYGKQEGESIRVAPENMQKYAEELNELSLEKISVEFDPLPISVLGDNKVSSFDMAWLDKFFFDDLEKRDK